MPATQHRVKGRYRIQRQLARGGQCRVYVADDEQADGASVVVKHMICRGESEQSRQEDLSLFLQESRILSQVQHPSLPRFIDAFEDEQGHWVVEERVGDTSLDAVLRDRPQGLDLNEVAWLGHQLLDLLAFLHNQRPAIVLRDVKPSNITCCVDEDGFIRRDRPVWFIDLTIAVHYVPGREDAVKMGSPGFAAPEQYRGRSQPRSDLYALGVTLFAALSGHDPVRTPFRLPPLSSLREDVPRGWDAFFERACALEPAQRFSSARDMREGLDRLLPAARCAGPLSTPRRSARRGGGVLSAGRLTLVLVAAAFLALVVALALGSRFSRRPATTPPALSFPLPPAPPSGRQSAPGRGRP